MTTNQYSAFFADLPQQPQPLSKPTSNDYSAFFSDLPAKPVVKEFLPPKKEEIKTPLLKPQKQYGPKPEPLLSRAKRNIQETLTPPKSDLLFKQPEMGPSQGLMPHGQASFFATKPKEMVLGGLISIVDFMEQAIGSRPMAAPGQKLNQMPSDLMKELAGITRDGESTLSPQEQEEARIFNFFANMGKPETFAKILINSEKTLGKSFLKDFTKITGKNAEKIQKLEEFLKGDITEGERKSAENIIANLKYADAQQNPINIFGDLWKKTKDRIKEKYNRVVNWNNVKPDDIKELQFVARQEAKKPVETPKPSVPETKAVKPPEKPVEPIKQAEPTTTKPKTEIVKPKVPREVLIPKDIQQGLKAPGIWQNEEEVKKLVKTKEMAEALLSRYEDMRFDITTAIIKSGGHQQARSIDILKEKDAKDAIKVLTKLSTQLPSETIKPKPPKEVEKPKVVEKVERPKKDSKTKPIQPKVEVKPPEPVTPSSKPSGYIRKPTPVTVPEKITHLTQKIKESDQFVKDLTTKIENHKAELEKLDKKDPKNLVRRNQLNTSIREAIKGRNDERVYGQKLRRDLKDIKNKKEQSKREVPLGSPTEKPLSKQQTQPTLPEAQRLQPVAGTEQAAKKSDIIKIFRKAFNDPIRLRKFKQRAGGIHKMWAKVSRLLNDNDVETAAHEIGHNLHTTLYGGNATTPKDQRANVERALKPYLNELKPIAPYEPYTLEGFAEFTRMYVTNPSAALKLAPKFYNKFEADLDAQYPELKNALLEARDYYAKYLQGTPLSRVKAQFSRKGKHGVIEKLREFAKNPRRFDKFVSEWVDDLRPVRRMVSEVMGIKMAEVNNVPVGSNPYKALRLLRPAFEKFKHFLEHGTLDFNSGKKNGESLKDILKDIESDDDLYNIESLMASQRTVEKNAQGIDTGIGYSDALLVIKELKQKYGDIANRLRDYSDRVLKYYFDSGMLTPQSYKKIKDSNTMYVPMFRDMESEKATGTGGAVKSMQAKQVPQRMKGSQRNWLPFIESITKNTFSMVMNAEKNAAGQNIANFSLMKNTGQFIEQIPTPIELKAKITREEAIEQIQKQIKKNLGIQGDLDIKDAQIQIDSFAIDIVDAIPLALTKYGATYYRNGNPILTVFKDGIPEFYETSPEIYSVWNAPADQFYLGIVGKVLRSFYNVGKAGATLSLKFSQKNAWKDAWDSYINRRYGSETKNPAKFVWEIVYSPIQGMFHAARKDDLYQQFMASGGGMNTATTMSPDMAAEHVESLRGKDRKWYQFHKKINHILREIARISEEGNRIAEFKRGIRSEGLTKEGKQEAAFASRELTIDFLKAGSVGRVVNRHLMFFNPPIQGTARLIQGIANPKTRNKTLAKALMTISIPSAIAWYLLKDDDDYKELTDIEKDQNIIFKWGDQFYNLPVGHEMGILGNGMMRRALEYAYTKDPKAFDEFFTNVFLSLAPSNLLLPAMQPFLEMSTNKDFFTGTPIIPAKLQNRISKFQYKQNTTLTARLLGRAIAYMTNPDTMSKAASPVVIDHFIYSWTKGLGRTAVSILDTALEAAGQGDDIIKPSRSFVEKYGLDAFKRRFPSSYSKSEEEFYEMYNDERARRSTYNWGEKEGAISEEELTGIGSRLEKDYDLKTLKFGKKALDQCQKAINEIYLSKDIEPDLKREMIEDLYKQKMQAARAAIKEIKEYRSL